MLSVQLYDYYENAFAERRADLIIHRVHIWAVWGHWSGEIKSGVSRRKSAIVSRALCAGALSGWTMKLSLDISLMHGSSFSFSSTSR